MEDDRREKKRKRRSRRNREKNTLGTEYHIPEGAYALGKEHVSLEDTVKVKDNGNAGMGLVKMRAGSTTGADNVSVTKAKIGESIIAKTPRRGRREADKRKRPRQKRRTRQLSGFEIVKANFFIILAVILGASLITVIGVWLNQENNELELSTDLQGGVQVTGKVGAAPVLVLKHSFPYAIKKETVLINGDGPELKENDDIYLKISVFDATYGKLLNKNGQPRQIVGKNQAKLLGKELFEAINNKKVGSRLLIKRPIKTENNTNSMELDVIDILPTIVKVKDIPSNLPVGYHQEGDLPKLEKTDFKFDSNQLFIIHSGAGQQIPANAKVYAQVGIWHGGVSKPISYSWNTEGPKILDLAKSYRSLAKQIPDLREGSRILLTIPAEDADGEASVVVVMDILGITN